jgi:hypothetical protein
MKASGSQTIDVTLPETIDGVTALVAAGVLTADDQAVLLAPCRIALNSAPVISQER